MRRPPRRAKQTERHESGRRAGSPVHGIRSWRHASRRWCWPANAMRAREQFGDLVAHQQRRAVRIAYSYLRDAHDADEAVQDAFVKVFTHITTYREEYPFEVWFTRILVNGCLDLRKARARRLRWALPMSSPAESAAGRSASRAAEPGRSRDLDRARRADRRKPSNSCPIVSARSSRCATSPSRARAKSARRSDSAKPPCGCICSAPCASFASCSHPSESRRSRSSRSRTLRSLEAPAATRSAG